MPQTIEEELDAIDGGLDEVGNGFASGEVTAAKLVKQTEAVKKHVANVRQLLPSKPSGATADVTKPIDGAPPSPAPSK